MNLRLRLARLLAPAEFVELEVLRHLREVSRRAFQDRIRRGEFAAAQRIASEELAAVQPVAADPRKAGLIDWGW